MPPRLMSCILGIGTFCACERPGSTIDTDEPIGGVVETGETGLGGDTGSAPTKSGLVVFHRYSSYDAWDSVLLMVDLADHSLTSYCGAQCCYPLLSVNQNLLVRSHLATFELGAN